MSDPECTSELTQAVSDSAPSSSVASQEFGLHTTHRTPTEWTNEKHRLYIGSLETSFVDKLYCSMRLRDCNPQRTTPGTRLPFKTNNSSDQVVVVQDRHFQKINRPGNDPLLESTADSYLSVESPRICSFTPAGKSCNRKYPDLQEHVLSSNKEALGGHLRKAYLKHLGVKTATSSKQTPACYLDSVGSTGAVSSQNFVDQVHGGKFSCELIRKRYERAAADVSSNDQLVPSGNFGTKEVMAHNALSKREEQGHHQLLLRAP